MTLSYSGLADRRGEREARVRARGRLRRARRASSTRRGLDIEAITAKVAAFAVAVPTWGVGTGGTRFARFPGPGEPRDIFDKLEDCATIQQLDARDADLLAAFPLGQGQRLSASSRERAKALGLGFDAVNSNTFQDQPGQTLSYKFGSLTHADEGRARPGGGAQHRMHRDRPEARLEGADGLDRRRLQFPRPVEPQPRLRLVSRSRSRQIYAAPARRLARVPRAQALRAGVLFDRDRRLGHRACMAAQALGPKAHLPRRPRPPRAERQHRADRRAARPRRASSRASISTIRNMATTTSTPARSTRSGCSACSTNSSTPPSARRRASPRPTCSTSRTTSPTRSRA